MQKARGCVGAGEPSPGTRLSPGFAGDQRACGAGREPAPGRPARHLFLIGFDRSVNAEVFAAFNLDQTRDLENKLLCAVGVKLSGTVETLVLQPAPGLGKIELRAPNCVI